MYLLDTNICIYLMKDRYPNLKQKFEDHTDDIILSTIVLSELYNGVAGSNRRAESQLNLDKFLSPIKILPYDEAAAKQYGIVFQHLKKQGTLIGPMDTLIAAHALALGATIITNNTREYDRIPNLKVEDWVNR